MLTYFKNMDNKKRGKESELRGAVLPVSLSSIVCHQLFLTTFPKILHYVVNDENSVLIILIIHQYLSYFNTLILRKVGEALLLYACHIENVDVADNALYVVRLAVLHAIAVAYIALDVVG